MTIPISRLLKEHLFQPLNGTDPTTYREIVTRDLLPSNATDERHQIHRFSDVNGRVITEDSTLHFCPVCGSVVHQDDTFCCIICFLRMCKTHARELTDIIPTPASAPSPSDPPVAPQTSSGICKRCSRKRFWLKVLHFPVLFIVRPIRAALLGESHHDAQQPPAK